MMTLLAHHVEAFHIPVLAVFFGIGCWTGWTLIGKLRPRNRNAKV